MSLQIVQKKHWLTHSTILYTQVTLHWTSLTSPLPPYSLSKEQPLETIAGIVCAEKWTGYKSFWVQHCMKTASNMWQRDFFLRFLKSRFMTDGQERTQVTRLLDRNYSLSSEKWSLLRTILDSYVLGSSLDPERSKGVFWVKLAWETQGRYTSLSKPLWRLSPEQAL